MNRPCYGPAIGRRRVWLPRDEGSVILQLDPGKGTTIVTGVSRWADLSGQANDIVQATTTKQPLIVTVNGLPYIKLDGVDDFFSPMTFSGGASPTATYFMVLRADALSASGTHDFVFVADIGIVPGVQSTNSNYGIADGGALNAGETMPVGSFHVYAFVNDTGSSSSVWRDGVRKSVGSDGGAGFGGGFTLGGLTAGTRTFAGTFGDILIYKGILPDWRIQRVSKMLSIKNNLGF